MTKTTLPPLKKRDPSSLGAIAAGLPACERCGRGNTDGRNCTTLAACARRAAFRAAGGTSPCDTQAEAAFRAAVAAAVEQMRAKGIAIDIPSEL